jgi:hypothetical protein
MQRGPTGKEWNCSRRLVPMTPAGISRDGRFPKKSLAFFGFCPNILSVIDEWSKKGR